jgi:hypothetical protein
VARLARRFGFSEYNVDPLLRRLRLSMWMARTSWRKKFAGGSLAPVHSSCVALSSCAFAWFTDDHVLADGNRSLQPLSGAAAHIRTFSTWSPSPRGRARLTYRVSSTSEPIAPRTTFLQRVSAAQQLIGLAVRPHARSFRGREDFEAARRRLSAPRS